MPTRNPELLEQQLNPVPAKKPKPVGQAVAVGSSYNVELQHLVKMIRADINTRLVPLLKQLEPQYRTVTDAEPVMTSDGWSDDLAAVFRYLVDKYQSPTFRALASTVARRFVRAADQVNRDRTMKAFGINILNDDQALTEFLNAAIHDNTQLISSIPEQYLTQVQNIVMTNVRAGNRSSAITKQLVKQYGVTERRAKFIARDQTAKINGDLVKRRQTSAGFPYFQWIDSDDEKVRERHSELAERATAYGVGIYRWDNPPLSDSGQPIIPGQDYGCRCVARPVSQAEVDKNVSAGRTRPDVKR